MYNKTLHFCRQEQSKEGDGWRRCCARSVLRGYAGHTGETTQGQSFVCWTQHRRKRRMNWHFRPGVLGPQDFQFCLVIASRTANRFSAERGYKPGQPSSSWRTPSLTKLDPWPHHLTNITRPAFTLSQRVLVEFAAASIKLCHLRQCIFPYFHCCIFVSLVLVLVQVAFSIRGLSRKEIRKLTVKNEMYVKSMKHTISHPTLHKSASCESLALKVSRSFSGPMTLESGTELLGPDEVRLFVLLWLFLLVPNS